MNRSAASGSALAFIGDRAMSDAIVDVRAPTRISPTILIATLDGEVATELTLTPAGDLVIGRR